MRTAYLLSLLMALVLVGHVETAHASANASAFVGYGMPGEPPGEDLMRLGYGGRLGLTMPIVPLYFGLSTTHHVGSADTEPDAKTNSLAYHALEFGVEVAAMGVGIRPYLMAGIADVDTDRDADGGFYSPAFGAGVAPFYNIIDTPVLELFLGLDARFVYLTTEVDNGDAQQVISAFPVYLEVGARLF